MIRASYLPRQVSCRQDLFEEATCEPVDSVSCSACVKPGQLGNGIGKLPRLEFILQGSILGIDPSTPSDRLFARFEMPRLRCDQSVGVATLKSWLMTNRTSSPRSFTIS